MALLQWRAAYNESLRKSTKKDSARARYLTWESAWLPLWKSEVDITYRLQKSVLAKGGPAQGAGFVRELLALQAKAAAVPAASELESLQEVALRRLTLLARTAEQLDRLGRGESRGAVTRVRRLSKDLTGLAEQLQDQRLAMLKAIAH